MPTSLSRESEVDVLIVGAGPAGVMACNALARAGINVRIIDERPSKVAAGQADGIQPRTIEVLQSYGLAERLLKEANQMHTAAFYNPGPNGSIELTERVPDVTVALSARYPFEATLHQGAIEAIFLDSMSSMGVEVSRPVIPTSIQLSTDENELKDPNAYPVRLTLKHLDPLEGQAVTEVVHAKFVVGADGAHSWVRKAFNIAMEGEQTEFIWGVVDMTPETDFPDIRNRCAIHSNEGSCMIIPREGDKVRLYIQLGDREAVDASSGRIDKNKVGPHYLLEVARKILHPFTFKTPEIFDWWTIYIIGQRVASKFSVRDRVFIAGDACHTHSPKAGQGMNASMNDTHNLAWKLAHVIRGWADMSLLKTYELERRKYAQDLIEFDKQFASLFSGKPRTETNQDGVSHNDFMQAFQTFGGFTSGIGIQYQDSAITLTTNQSCAVNLVIGRRMLPQIFLRAADFKPVELHDLLPSDSRFKVLLFPGSISSQLQRERLELVSEKLIAILRQHSPSEDVFLKFDILSISSATKATVRYNDVPERLRSHWSKVLIDDVDVRGTQGGDGYSNFGISSTEGAVAIIRPDGYVGALASLQNIDDIDKYFKGFKGSNEHHN